MIKDKVLVVDADKSTRDAVKILLELNEMEVSFAGDGQSALKKSSHTSFSLVLCALNETDNNNAYLISELKADTRYYRTPVIALLESDAEKDIRDAMHTGADDFVVKPFSGKLLIATIKHRLELSRQYKALHNNEVSERLFSLLNKNFNQELLTPLNGIINTTVLMENLVASGDTDMIGELLTVIYASSYRIMRTTQNLLTYSSLNLSSEQAPLHHSTGIVLQDLLKQVTSRYENGQTPNQGKIDVEALQVGTWDGPAEYVRIIFTELIDNAIKFSPAAAALQVKLTALHNSFTFTVTNETRESSYFGIDDIAPFKKFHNDLSRNGLGLGLFISWAICQKMGYHLSLSRKGGRTSFTVEANG